MKLRHKATGDEFEMDAIASSHDSIVRVWDENGFMHYVKREFLETVPVEEEWETISGHALTTLEGGTLRLFLHGKWVAFPHKDLRFHEINGVPVLQQRKR